jgi:hypothetical protein
MHIFCQFFRKTKVFCVGRNKTGTTSLAAALQLLGYRVANQQEGELLIEDWAKRDFRSLIAYCRKSDAFQDIPFSIDFTFQAMDQAFPGSKFILTVRDSDEQWYDSMVRFHTMRLRERTGENRLPKARDLQEDPYIYSGYLWRLRQLVGGASEHDDLFEKNVLIRNYNEHNRRVEDYFRHRPDDFMVLNVGESSAIEKLCQFLGKSYAGEKMPKLNESN